MVALAFPASPTNGQTYVGPNGVTYTFHGDHWHTGAEGAAAFSRVWIGDTPPAGAFVEGIFWWNSDEGLLYLNYDGGNGLQWVPASVAIQPSEHRKLVQSFSAVGATNVILTDLTAYDEYELHLDRIRSPVSPPAVLMVHVYLNVSTDNGVTWKTSGYKSFSLYSSAGEAAGAGGTNTVTVMALTPTNSYAPVPDDVVPFSARIDFSPRGTDRRKLFRTVCAMQTTKVGNPPGLVSGIHYWDGGNDAVNALRINFASSTGLTSGYVRLYGVQG
jgi:hypothetical protein